MLEKRLGKIDFVEFGTMRDYPFQLGLQLGFSMSGSGVMDAGKYTVNISPAFLQMTPASSRSPMSLFGTL